jgi:hypothetical protein
VRSEDATSRRRNRGDSAMGPIEVECGKSHTERQTLSFTKADKDRILQNFPDKIVVSVAGFGPQEYPLRPYVKAILDQVEPPELKISFAVRGEPDDIDTIEINDVEMKVIGTTSGTFKVGDVTIDYAFDADILPGEIAIESCECGQGGEGQRMSRTFRCTWEIEVSIEPGTSGVYEVEEFDIVVTSSCDCPDEYESEGEEHDDGENGDDEEDEDDDSDDEEDDDEEEDEDEEDDDAEGGKKKKKSGKKKAKGRGK